MARDNQGLQIALIIVVMLLAVTSVTTFVYVQKSTEAEKKQKISDDTATAADSARLQVEDENKQLKKMMGFAPTLSMRETIALKEKDVKSFAGTLSVDTYSPVLQQLVGTIQKKDKSLADKDAEITRLENEYADRVQAMKSQVAEFEKVAKESGGRVVQLIQDSEKARADLLSQLQTLTKVIDGMKGADRTVIDRLKQEIGKLNGKLEELGRIHADFQKQLALFRRPLPDRFLGEIVTVGQHQAAPYGSTWARPTGWSRKSRSASIPAIPRTRPRPRRRPPSR